MRKAFTVLLITLSAAMSGYAQETDKKEQAFKEKFPFEYEVRLGYGGAPLYDYENFLWREYWDVMPYPVNPSLSNLYGKQEGSEFVTGVISAEFSIHFRRWFSFAIYAGVNGIWGETYSPSDKVTSSKNGASVNIIPQARFWWFTTPCVRMYSSIGVGIYAGRYAGESYLTPAAQLTPVGITAGRKIFFFAEGSIGTAYMGGKFGLGYRF